MRGIYLFDSYEPLAQLAEHFTFNERVWSSNLQWLTTSEQALYRLLRLFAKVRARSFCCSSFPNQIRCAGLRFGFGCRPESRASILFRYSRSPRTILSSRRLFYNQCPFGRFHRSLAEHAEGASYVYLHKSISCQYNSALSCDLLDFRAPLRMGNNGFGPMFCLRPKRGKNLSDI